MLVRRSSRRYNPFRRSLAFSLPTQVAPHLHLLDGGTMILTVFAMPAFFLPFDRSYWAVPDRLLAGYYPGDLDPAVAQRKLAGLVRCGVGLVINLMEPDEVNWNGKPFADYRPTLEALARTEGRAIRCERIPIRDADVPTVALMRTILDTIDHANAAGEIVYVHCLGGLGRTGTADRVLLGPPRDCCRHSSAGALERVSQSLAVQLRTRAANASAVQFRLWLETASMRVPGALLPESPFTSAA
jgi:hypothetical protein